MSLSVPTKNLERHDSFSVTSDRELLLVSDFPYELHPTQELAFNESWASEILYGGAKGGGKSFLMRFASVMWCLNCPGLQVYLFRREFPELWKNHMEGPCSYPVILGKLVRKNFCSIVGKEIRWWNGARIFLNHLQHEKHVTKYQGVEIHALLIDELTQFSEASYRYIRGSVRLGSWQPPPGMNGVFPKILCGANPGGISHAFVKQTFVDLGAYRIRRMPKEEGGMLRQFIPARAEDNPALLRNDPDYLDRLEGLGNPELVRAMREGDWEVVAGSMFGYIWRQHRHVMPRGFSIPVTWQVWRGGDDGFAKPAAIHWLTQDPDTGTFYVIDEIYAARLLPEELAEKILKHDRAIRLDYGEGDIDYNDLALDGELDSAAFSDIGTGSESRAAQMNRARCRWRPVEKGRGSRVARVQMLHRVLAPNPKERQVDRDGIKMPGIRLFPACIHAIRTLKQLPISENNPEDIDTDAEDHPFDSITYALTRRKRFFAPLKVRGL